MFLIKGIYNTYTTLADFLMNFHSQLRDGLGSVDTTSLIVALKMDSVEIEVPLSVRLTGLTGALPYRRILIEPLAESPGITRVSRPCRMKIRWNITYAG